MAAISSTATADTIVSSVYYDVGQDEKNWSSGGAVKSSIPEALGACPTIMFFSCTRPNIEFKIANLEPIWNPFGKAFLNFSFCSKSFQTALLPSSHRLL